MLCGDIRTCHDIFVVSMLNFLQDVSVAHFSVGGNGSQMLNLRRLQERFHNIGYILTVHRKDKHKIFIANIIDLCNINYGIA